MPNVFISYSRESIDCVRRLADDIDALGQAAWYDQDLSGGHAWWDEILSRIRAADVFVFAISPDALVSMACDRECDYAIKVGKPVLPILVADGVSPNLLPSSLATIQFVDYRNNDRDSALSLARAFASMPAAGELPEPLPNPPDVPMSYLGDLAERIGSEGTLSFEEQSALLVDIKSFLRVPENAEDARTLLYRFRERRDLLATIGAEIDHVVNMTYPGAVPRKKQERSGDKAIVEKVAAVRKRRVWLRFVVFLAVFAIFGAFLTAFIDSLSAQRYISGKTVSRSVRFESAASLASLIAVIGFLLTFIGDWFGGRRRWLGISVCFVGFFGLGVLALGVLDSWRVTGQGEGITASIVWVTGVAATIAVALLNRRGKPTS